MNITFNSSNGYCPNYIYENITFYIQDFKDDNNNYVYRLLSTDSISEKLVFLTHEIALENIRNIKNIKTKYEDWEKEKFLFSTLLNDYIVNGNIVTLKKIPNTLSEGFNNYYDCLNFAKKYVENIIKENKPTQLKMPV